MNVGGGLALKTGKYEPSEGRYPSMPCYLPVFRDSARRHTGLDIGRADVGRRRTRSVGFTG